MYIKGIYLDDFFSIVSKHDEHNKCPFLIQNVLVDLSISLRQIKHLNIGGIQYFNEHCYVKYFQIKSKYLYLNLKRDLSKFYK